MVSFMVLLGVAPGAQIPVQLPPPRAIVSLQPVHAVAVQPPAGAVGPVVVPASVVPGPVVIVRASTAVKVGRSLSGSSLSCLSFRGGWASLLPLCSAKKDKGVRRTPPPLSELPSSF